LETGIYRYVYPGFGRTCWHLLQRSIYLVFGGKRELYDRPLATYREESMTRLGKNLKKAEYPLEGFDRDVYYCGSAVAP
jgi:hypothetical protein